MAARQHLAVTSIHEADEHDEQRKQREQQRQTRELTTQTGLLRDVKRAIENKPTASTTTLNPVFA